MPTSKKKPRAQKGKSAHISGSEANSASSYDSQISRACITPKIVPVIFVMSGVTHSKTGFISRVIGGNAELNLYVAGMYLPEQHYYGESKPTKDMDVENIVYLKLKQELKNLAKARIWTASFFAKFI